MATNPNPNNPGSSSTTGSKGSQNSSYSQTSRNPQDKDNKQKHPQSGGTPSATVVEDHDNDRNQNANDEQRKAGTAGTDAETQSRTEQVDSEKFRRRAENESFDVSKGQTRNEDPSRRAQPAGTVDASGQNKSTDSESRQRSDNPDDRNRTAGKRNEDPSQRQRQNQTQNSKDQNPQPNLREEGETARPAATTKQDLDRTGQRGHSASGTPTSNQENAQRASSQNRPTQTDNSKR